MSALLYIIEPALILSILVVGSIIVIGLGAALCAHMLGEIIDYYFDEAGHD